MKEYEEVFLYAVAALDGKYEALKSLGIVLSYDKKFLEAVEVLEQAKLVKSGDSEISYHLGFSYLNLARTVNDEKADFVKRAQREFEQGIVLDQENDAFHYGLGILYGFVLEDFNKAIPYLDKAYALNEKNFNALFALANVHYQQGNVDLAKGFYQEVIDNFPDREDKVAKAKENLKKINASF